ncbi:MAG: tetratricopeptide repeat protein, partial [Bacteroidia bacterium]
YNRAIVKYKLKDYNGAIIDFTSSIKLNPSDNTAFYNRADVKAALYDFEGAIEDCSKALELEPFDAYTYYNRGYYFSKILDLKNAIEDYNKAISINPKFIPAFRQRGVAYSKIGNYKSSLNDFNYVIIYQLGKIDGIDDNNPNNKPSDYFNRAVTKYYLDDKEGACRDAKKAMEFGYSSNKIKYFQCE